MSLTLRGVLVLAAVVAAAVLAILILTGTHTLADTAHLLAWAVIALAVGLVRGGGTGPMIPVASTTLTVLRRPDPADAYEDDDPQSYAPVAAGIRGHLDAGSGSSTFAGGQRSDSLVRFMCDPCDLTTLDLILDERTGLRWQVTAVAARPTAEGILDHMSGLAQRWEGVAG